jgi:hypothetical protein
MIRVITTADFGVFLTVIGISGLVIVKCVEWSVTLRACTLESLDHWNKAAGDEHHLEVQCPRHVQKSGESWIDRRSLQVGDLVLAEPESVGELTLAELTAESGFPNQLEEARAGCPRIRFM